MVRRTRLTHALLAALVTCGCGMDRVADPPVDADDETTSWRIDVSAQEGTAFGARILLNGEQVYLEAEAARSHHSFDVTRPYRPGQNLVEVEIVSAKTNPSVYVAACSVRVSPNGKMLIADGIPWTLSVGERLFLRIPL